MISGYAYISLVIRANTVIYCYGCIDISVVLIQ